MEFSDASAPVACADSACLRCECVSLTVKFIVICNGGNEGFSAPNRLYATMESVNLQIYIYTNTRARDYRITKSSRLIFKCYKIYVFFFSKRNHVHTNKLHLDDNFHTLLTKYKNL